MPRPAPLRNLATGRPQPNYQSLTPRTPHSRSGRAEEAVDDQLANDYRAYTQQQTEPLLASSADDSFPPSGYRRRGDDHDPAVEKDPATTKRIRTFICQGIPLLFGCATAGVLLILILLAVERPDTLEWWIGGTEASVVSQSILPSPQVTPKPDLDAASPPSPQVTQDPDLDAAPPDFNTISYENYTNFPLLPIEYLYECNVMMSGWMHHGSFWGVPPSGGKDVLHHDDVEDYHLPEGEMTRVCTSTITYMLDGHVGLMADLALMVQVAGLARELNRTFLVDDTYWNRGKWTDHFQHVRGLQPGPEPGCRAPPPEELVACPRTARHWVLNSRTVKFHFGHPFYDEYEDPYAHGVNRLKPIFTRSVESFTHTIRPNALNAALIRSARQEVLTGLSAISESLSQSTSEDSTSASMDADADSESESESEIKRQSSYSEPYVAVHIRRGDKHAESWAYHNSFVPIPNYVESLESTSSRLNLTSPSAVYLATDSPTAHSEFSSSFTSDTPIAIFSLRDSSNSELRELASAEEYRQREFNDLGEEERVRLTRGMVVDFAMVSGMWRWEGDVGPAATVCTISSNVCKMAAVGYGFDKAFGFDQGVNQMGSINEKRKRWVEIDNKDAVAPVWRAFELFM